MNLRTIAALTLFLAGLSIGHVQASPWPPLEGDVRTVHDPAAVQHEGTFYLFSTGPGIPIRCSPDLREWRLCGQVFFQWPEWIRSEIPGAKDLWAPDIAYFNGKYHLYYSASTFGSNRSVIGLATNVTLDRSDPNYAWVDEGKVLESHEADSYNAIDPNVVFDRDGNLWLALGSFWSGIKLRRLDPETGKPSAQDPALHSLASRPEAPHAIEAPFIIYREPYYYLFVSFDFCCRGAESTYHIRVGRSPSITGPYVDREGIPMLEGGGTLVLSGWDRWRGPGHQAVLRSEQGDYLIFHAYDALFAGWATLHVAPMLWDEEGWPMVSVDGA